MKHTTLIIIMMLLTACCADPQGLRIKNRDVVADIIAHADTQQTTVTIVDRTAALNLLSEVN